MTNAQCPPDCAGCRELADPPGAWLNDMFGPSSRDTVQTHRRMLVVDSGVPRCPLCKAQMVKESLPRGLFWVCARSPHCTGFRPILKAVS